MISKRIYPSYWFGGDQAVRLLDLHSRGFDRSQMQKMAASEYIMAIDAKPVKGFSFVHIITTGAGEHYGCVAGSTPIDMADGSHIRMEDVHVGDYVLSGSGNIRQVLTRFERDVPYHYKVDVEGIPEPLLLSANHPMKVAKKEQFVCGRDKHMRTFPETVGLRSICHRRETCDRCRHLLDGIRKERVVAEELRPGDYLLFQIPAVKADFELTAEEAIMMGYWLAEGCFQRNGSNQEVCSLRFNFGLHEKETLVPVCKQAAEREGWSTSVYPQENRSCALLTATGHPERSREWLAWFGSGARNKKIPLWMYTQPVGVRIQLLRAYFEGDGHVDRALVYGHSASYDLAVGIQRLLWSVGIPATVNEVQKGRKGHGYHVSYQRNKAAGTVLGFGTQEKPSLEIRTFVDRGTAYLPVRKVIKVDAPLHVHNMEVEEDHDYVSGGIYSHNCNNNADYYNEKEATVEIPNPKAGTDHLIHLEGGLLSFHPTFMKYGAVYREHVNSRKGGIPQGEVFAESYNPVMHRGELVLKLDDEHWRDDLQKLANGDPVFWSIGCGVPRDCCSICGNWARTRREYCFRGDMLVTMGDNSTKAISEVQQGDYIMDSEGNSVLVTEVGSRVVDEDVVHLTTNFNELETVVTKEHPFRTCKTTEESPNVPVKQYAEVDTLVVNDIVYQPVPAAIREQVFRPENYKGLPLDGYLWEGKILTKSTANFSGTVYNLTTATGSYIVNGITVHNCDDMKYNRLGLTKTGHQVFVYNDQPHFHDISRVAVPADRIAFALRKVASQGDVLVPFTATEDWLPLSVIQKIGTQTEADHARALEKAAEIEKKILAQGMSPEQATVSGALSSRKLDPKTVAELQRYPLQDVVFELNKRAVLLPISEFARIVIRKPAEDIPGLGKVGCVLSRLFSGIEDSDVTEVISDAAYTPLHPRSWAGLSAAADAAQRDLSMEEGPIRSRIVKVAMQEPMRKTATVGEAGAESKVLAKEYAKYQLSFLTGAGIDKYAIATVLANQSVE